MTHDEIIRMAREAGWWTLPRILRVRLERFAALVAAAEREECAKVCEEVARGDETGYGVAEDCAAAIRARGS